MNVDEILEKFEAMPSDKFEQWIESQSDEVKASFASLFRTDSVEGVKKTPRKKNE